MRELAMKKLLFATTAAATTLAGGMAFAQGVTVFGDARLGLGYNVVRNGDIVGPGEAINTNLPATTLEEDELRAISRVRFGVRMTGETDTGITFGATIRADNAGGGAGGTAPFIGNSGGNVFVSGAFGTLTYGDIASAHQQHTGDFPEVGLTGIGFINEPTYLGNRQGSANRPTVRYDFDLAGFGISLGTNNELDEYGIGASFSPNFGGGNFSIGGGYYDTDDNSQWTVGVSGGFAGFTGNVIYIDSDNPATITDPDGPDGPIEVISPGGGSRSLGVGLGTTLADIGLNAFWRESFGDGIDLFDGDSAYGVGATFALGTGASLRGGWVRTFGGTNAADLGIQLTF
jgi:outer membrane protein OmpU